MPKGDNKIDVTNLNIDDLNALIEAKKAEEFAEGIDWPMFRVSEKGVKKIYGHLLNTEKLFERYDITVRYNEMSKELDIDIPHKTYHCDTKFNAELVDLQDLARSHDYIPGVIHDHLIVSGNQNAYSPVRDWILSKEWDGVDRYKQIIDSLETPEPEYAKIMFRRWMLGGVKGVFDKDGVNSQGVFTLSGKQGKGKTRWLKSLVPNQDWFKEGVVLNTRDKDDKLLFVSRWIVELGELDATFTAQGIAALKAFITNQVDSIRPPYAQKKNDYPRRTILCASVNDTGFLQDHENRRYWVIEVTKLNPEHKVDIQQMWAQAYYEYSVKGEGHWPTNIELKLVEEQNKAFQAVNPLFELFHDYFERPEDSDHEFTIRMGAFAICEHIGWTERPLKKFSNHLAEYLKLQGYSRREDDMKFTLAVKSGKALPSMTI